MSEGPCTKLAAGISLFCFTPHLDAFAHRLHLGKIRGAGDEVGVGLLEGISGSHAGLPGLVSKAVFQSCFWTRQPP